MWHIIITVARVLALVKWRLCLEPVTLDSFNIACVAELGGSGRKRERARARETGPFFLVPTTSKRLLRRLVSVRTDKLAAL